MEGLRQHLDGFAVECPVARARPRPPARLLRQLRSADRHAGVRALQQAGRPRPRPLSRKRHIGCGGAQHGPSACRGGDIGRTDGPGEEEAGRAGPGPRRACASGRQLVPQNPPARAETARARGPRVRAASGAAPALPQHHPVYRRRPRPLERRRHGWFSANVPAGGESRVRAA